jgi:magnesium-transporting ATPase (P-type)
MCLWLPLLSLAFLTSEHMREAFGYYEEPTHFLGAFFALFVFADICNSVSARTMHPNPAHRLCKNKTFVCIFAFIIAVQLCIIELGGAVFRTHPLAMDELALVLFFAALTLPVSAVVKIALERWEGGK